MRTGSLRPARVNPVVRHPKEKRVRLDGEWRFRLEPEGSPERSGPPRAAALRGRIRVPGCWQGQGFGGDGTDTVRDFNLRARVFRATSTGTGWYGRTFEVPAAWAGKRVWINFGGAHPSAEVWMNGIRLGENGLPFVPFAFDATDAVRRSGTNELLVRVHEKNREFGLAYDWQGNWSGLYRGVELSATGPAWFERCVVLPDAATGEILLRVAVDGPCAGLTLTAKARPLKGGGAAVSAGFPVGAREAEFRLRVPSPRPWSPDAPNLYRVDVALERGGETTDARSERTGFVALEPRARHILVNGEPYYMRGSGDFLSCPETGCPDTDRRRWRRKLRTLRAYGYNYVRCQSYVYGPEYYDAADEVGLLVQGEMGMLGAWGGTSPWHVYAWPRPTPDKRPILREQWNLVVERDAAHPSANLYCMSNELGDTTHFPRTAWECYRETKLRKPSALVIWTDGGYRPELPGDFVNRFVDRFVGGAKQDELDRIAKPVIEHEFMWWSSFPDVRLRKKYRGAIRPYAAEIAAETAARRGQTRLLEVYADRSKRLQLIEAKAKMEGMRRDFPRLAGICHFNAMDANPSPQGVVTEFYERKLVGPGEWRRTNGDTVVLCDLGFDNRCRAAGEPVRVRFSVSDFSHPPFRRPHLRWRILAGTDVIASGETVFVHEPFATSPAGEMAWTVPPLAAARRVVLEAHLSEGNRAVVNRWDLWLFPKENPLPPGTAVRGPAEHTWLREWREIPSIPPGGRPAAGGPVLTERLDRKTADFMRAGGRVVLAAGEGLVRPHQPLFGFVRYFFTPPANYAPYEDGQNGTVIARHPALGGMPHDGFADWQFFRMIENAPPLDLEPLGLAGGDPVIRVIHRYPVLHPLGYLVERRVGRGGLVLCALDLRPDFIEARFLLAAVCRHAASDRFRPARGLSKAATERIMKECALP